MHKLPVIILVTCLTQPVALGADLIVDAATVTISSSNLQASYDVVKVINGGNLVISLSNKYVRAATLVVDVSSSINGARRPIVDLGNTEWGGGNGGLGGGQGATYPEPWHPREPAENALRRVDILYFGSGGAKGPDRVIGCHPRDPNVTLTILGERGGFGSISVGLVADYMHISGRVCANGEDSPTGYQRVDCWPHSNYDYPRPFGGGGGGGSVHLIARELHVEPSAIIQANGGDGGAYYSGYAGGGGRIKIFYESANIPSLAVIEARAGEDHAHSSSQLYGVWAQDGTVFVRQTDNIDWLFEPNADVDRNGVVDENDLHAIVSQWHQVDPTMTPTPWPVPTHTPVP